MSQFSTTGDPVSDVILDFQSVMAQWLDVQAAVVGAAQRAALSASPALRSPDAAVEGAVPPTVAATTAVAAPVGPETPAAVEPPSVVRAAASAGASMKAVEPTGAPEPAASRYTLSVRPCPAGQARGGLAAGHVVVVTDDGTGVADRTAERLRGEGLRVVLVVAAGESDPAHGLFVSPLDSVDEAERLVQQVRDTAGPVAALVHLSPLSASPDFDALDADAWWNRLSSDTRAFFLLARALGTSLQEAGRNGGAAIVSVTSMGGAFGVTPAAGTAPESLAPSQGGAVGLAKCLAIEWPDVRVRALDLDVSAGADACAVQIVDELRELDSPTEIGYYGGQRVGLGVDLHPAVPAASFVVPSDGVILATGGARGITAEVCLELAERYGPTFVLVGQSPLPPATEAPDTARFDAPADLKRALTARLQGGGGKVTPAAVERAYRTLMKEREIREMMSRLSASGARSHYVQMDVQDSAAFGALIDEIYETYGRIDGVIHGAGIIEDKLVRDKTLESFDRVFRVKTLSAFTLCRHLDPASLKFLVFFSSVAGRFGNRGQGDYAAANEVISKLAVRLQRQWPARVCAIAWAPWDKLGMVGPELKREFARRGVGLLSPLEGRRALWREIQQRPGNAAEVVVAGAGDPSPTGLDERAATPLLKGAVRSATGHTISFERVLVPSADKYLNDHKLDGRPVLPLAFATEHMAQAAQTVWPDLRVVGVRGLQLFKGITVESEPVRMVVSVASQLRQGNDGLFEADAEILTPAAKPPMRYRSIVQLAQQGQAPPVWEPVPRPLQPLSRTLSRAYREWTFHGLLFQRVTSIAGVGPESILGTIYSSSAITGLSEVHRAGWIIDPYVFDAALQLLLIWSREHNDKTALPSRFHSFRRYAPLSDVQLTCDVSVESLAGGHALKSTVRFVDASGRVRAVLEGMEASCTQALNRLATVVPGEGGHERHE